MFLSYTHSLIPFPLPSLCFQSKSSATMLPVLVPISTNNKLNSFLRVPPISFPCPKSLVVPTLCTLPICTAPSSYLSPSTPPLLSSHPQPLLQSLALRSFSIPSSIVASLLCCSQPHWPHPSSTCSHTHPGPCSVAVSPLSSGSKTSPCSTFSFKSPYGAHQSSSQGWVPLYFIES